MKRTLSALTASTALLGLHPFASAKLALNNTGMTHCMSADGTLSTSCTATGQDAESGRDVTHSKAKDGKAGFSFLKTCNSGEAAGQGSCPSNPSAGNLPNQWGCTLDRVTGLLWERKTDDGSERDYRKKFSNQGDKRAGDASAYVDIVNQSGLCGRTDWRLPTVLEAQGLMDFGVSTPDPKIDAKWFPHTASAVWTGIVYASNGKNRWAMGFDSGLTSDWLRSGKVGVMLVSSTQSAAAGDRFAANGSEVLDRKTGLVWARCSEGQTWIGTTCVGEPTLFVWRDALARAMEVASATGKPWRVPNEKELASLAKHSTWMPAIDSNFFPSTATSARYWSSTARAEFEAAFGPEAWIVGFGDGRSSFNAVYLENVVRLVRNPD